MQKQLAAVAAAALTVFGATTFSVGAAAAATEPIGEMPEVKGMFLHHAIKAVYDVTGPVELDVQTYDTKGNREQINKANWTVCWQYPKAGADLVLYESKVTVAFGVRRSTDPGCWQ